MAALVGGGTRPKPGEASLAHLGVLFLDELPEFQPGVLDALRQPLETGEVIVARANHRIAYPARVQLVARHEPVPVRRRVTGPELQARAALRRRLSGAHLGAAARPHRSPDRGAGGDGRRSRAAARPPKDSAEVRERGRSGARGSACAFRGARRAKGVRTNADCSGHLLEEIAMPDDAGLALLRQAAETLGLSARGFHRTLRVARTLADLDGSGRRRAACTSRRRCRIGGRRGQEETAIQHCLNFNA